MADNVDRAAVTIQQSLEATLANRAALARHVTNTECDDCGYEIPVARRQAAPWATTCIGCQGIREHKARGFRE
ncbi:TraR/DksA C4-type zinc finger protein [Vreelandella aquamarina]|uniref:Zinc finger DksA/TraR C4-type domain-containing protein n=1 Tax=Vreelandella aquamarina TaxID=77097 RepID=A0A857GIM2_9GAMM|nr:TraR/DksA C4-type zinc finger protein [Halomonas meridiana]QHD49129.1 hypothetical protein CTT34_05185 [Halomonas meridiana]